MSILFTPKKIGDVVIANRFIHSAVKRFREGKTTRASCESCNRCLAALPGDLRVRCYFKGLPA